MQEKNKNRPIFIVGCERSGTTMLRLILCSHKNIAIPPQTKYAKKLYKRRLLFGDLSKADNRKKLRNWFLNNHNKKTKIIDLDIDKNDVREELKITGNTLGAFLSVIPKLYSKKFGKSRWGDKRPYYIKYLPQLFKLFPDAQVIHIIRDGRDAVASLKRMPWWNKNSLFAMLNWQEAIQHGIIAKSKYSSEQYIEIKYEDIINEPENSIKSVCKFLGEEYSESLLEFHKIAKESVPSYKMDWHSATKSKINAASIGRWQKDLEQWEVILFNRKFKNELESHKYEIQDKPKKLPIGIHLKFYFTKLKYRFNQYGVSFVDKVISILYWWELDYRK